MPNMLGIKNAAKVWT